MKKYDGWLIVSDMDATLLDENKQISAENKQAIDYFIENGGLFTVASGRMATEVKMYFDTFSISLSSSFVFWSFIPNNTSTFDSDFL